MKVLFFLILSTLIFSSEQDTLKRVYAHLLIHDYPAATKECARGLAEYPASEKLQKIYVKTLAQGGRDEEAIHFSSHRR